MTATYVSMGDYNVTLLVEVWDFKLSLKLVTGQLQKVLSDSC